MKKGNIIGNKMYASRYDHLNTANKFADKFLQFDDMTIFALYFNLKKGDF